MSDAAVPTSGPPSPTATRVRAVGAGARALPSGLVRAVPMLLVAEREARVWGHLWQTSLLTGVLMPVLFLGAMGVGLGGLVDENRGTVEGVDYLEFVTPGILAATALQSAAGESLWPVMAGMKWVKTFHAAAATSLSPGQVFGGYAHLGDRPLLLNAVAVPGRRGADRGCPVALGCPGRPRRRAGGPGVRRPVDGVLGGARQRPSFSVIMRIVVLPMFLFSGTFFPVDQLPDGLEPLARVTPLWHAVELCRGATTGTLSLAGAVGHSAFLLAVVAAGCWWGVATFRAKLAP